MKELTALDPNKAAGPDDVAAFFILIAAPVIAAPLTALINVSFHTAEIPTACCMEKSACAPPV